VDRDGDRRLHIAFACVLLFVLYGCAAQPHVTASPKPPLSSSGPTPTVGASQRPAASIATAPPTPSPTESGTPEPLDTGGGTTTGGDIPDNAVFLKYTDAAHHFSIQYVEGWQVTPGSDGVVMRDKDSSEIVQVVPQVSDVATYVTSVDLPQLQALAGFTLDKQDIVTVNGVQLSHIVYHAPSPPDPVTGKQIPSTIDRYYVPGPNGFAIISLSTPDGVDNVDAFRQMINSFTWL
jgi:hypothetical protein